MAHPGVAAWLALVIVTIHPSDGTGLPLCPLHAATGLPCPGCGMTRSLSSCAHGHLASAWDYHPFGPALFVMLVVVAMIAILPPRWRAAVAAPLARHRRTARALGIAFVAAFFAFGALRLVIHALS